MKQFLALLVASVLGVSPAFAGPALRLSLSAGQVSMSDWDARDYKFSALRTEVQLINRGVQFCLGVSWVLPRLHGRFSKELFLFLAHLQLTPLSWIIYPLDIVEDIRSCLRSSRILSPVYPLTF